LNVPRKIGGSRPLPRYGFRHGAETRRDGRKGLKT
jgi:hypothetical protein